MVDGGGPVGRTRVFGDGLERGSVVGTNRDDREAGSSYVEGGRVTDGRVGGVDEANHDGWTVDVDGGWFELGGGWIREWKSDEWLMGCWMVDGAECRHWTLRGLLVTVRGG